MYLFIGDVTKRNKFLAEWLVEPLSPEQLGLENIDYILNLMNTDPFSLGMAQILTRRERHRIPVNLDNTYWAALEVS